MTIKISAFQLSLLLAVATGAAQANASDLNNAFVAAFAQPAPVKREASQLVFSLQPEALVPLGNDRFALLVTEASDTWGAGGASLDALAVAYMIQSGDTWTTEQIWFEVGGPGFAGNDKKELRSFGGSPLYFTTNRWCGSNACSNTINVLAFDPSGPQAFGKIKGGAVYPLSLPNTSLYCEPTEYTATIGPPASSANRFSVTYEGWVALGLKMLPRHAFHRTADVTTRGDRLETNLQTPDCTR